MRLIDVDALGIGKAKREAFENQAYADGWNSAIEIIETAPTIDPEELRPKGRWIVHGNSCECSNCNTVGSPHWKCCPVCEVKMEDV